MNEQKTLPVITICREYGAGGRTLAKALSERLGLEWYDRDLVRKTSETSGYSIADIDADGEELKSGTKLLDSLLNSIVSYTSSHDGIFKAQKETILELAGSPCIIVGRCANVILQEAGVKTFDIFLYADLAKRAARAAELGENEEMDLQKYIAKRDELRDNYYKAYTGRTQGYYHDYDLVLNTGIMSTEQCVDLIVSLL